MGLDSVGTEKYAIHRYFRGLMLVNGPSSWDVTTWYQSLGMQLPRP